MELENGSSARANYRVDADCAGLHHRRRGVSAVSHALQHRARRLDRRRHDFELPLPVPHRHNSAGAEYPAVYGRSGGSIDFFSDILQFLAKFCKKASLSILYNKLRRFLV